MDMGYLLGNIRDDSLGFRFQGVGFLFKDYTRGLYQTTRGAPVSSVKGTFAGLILTVAHISCWVLPPTAMISL